MTLTAQGFPRHLRLRLARYRRQPESLCRLAVRESSTICRSMGIRSGSRVKLASCRRSYAAGSITRRSRSICVRASPTEPRASTRRLPPRRSPQNRAARVRTRSGCFCCANEFELGRANRRLMHRHARSRSPRVAALSIAPLQGFIHFRPIALRYVKAQIAASRLRDAKHIARREHDIGA